MLIISRLAALHLSELRFGKVGYLKDGSQSCLAQSNPQEPVNLQRIKNRIHIMVFSHYAQESWNVISWRLGDINFKVSPGLHPWTSSESLQRPLKFSIVSSLAYAYIEREREREKERERKTDRQTGAYRQTDRQRNSERIVTPIKNFNRSKFHL